MSGGSWISVGDFWNDPRRWDGIDDSHKTCFWMVRRPDVIDVWREPVLAGHFANETVQSVSGRMGRVSGSVIIGNQTANLATTVMVGDCLCHGQKSPYASYQQQNTPANLMGFVHMAASIR